MEPGAVADESYLLALLNSTPMVGGVEHDELTGRSAALAWIDQHVPNAPRTTDLGLLRATRSSLQAVVRGEQPSSVLRPTLDGVTMRPKLTGDGVTWDLDVRTGRLAAVRAVLAWDAVGTALPGRLRSCANLECRRFLIDRSRPNRARWCSMARCGNRMKARRNYERHRSGG